MIYAQQSDIKQFISNSAHAQGFDAVGFASPDIGAHARAGLENFLRGGHHGDMGWMAEKADRRADPRAIWPAVKSIIVLGQNYGPARDPMERLERREIGNISVYALNKDYHDVIKKKLKALARQIAREFGCQVKVFVDTAPVMEKPLAAQAGLGWQGKHTCLVSREFGSWLFLGEIFTDMNLSPHPNPLPLAGEGSAGAARAGEGGHCGTCTRCLDICPTRAFPGPGRLDATRCISYLTIEHKGHIAREFREAIGNRIYGCDDCLAVCPWNKFAQNAREAAYHPRADLEAPLLSELAMLDDAAFRRMFAGSPVKRIGRDRFVRNVLIAIGNSGNPAHAPLLETLLADASPLVRAMAVWALSRLVECDTWLDFQARFMPHERDADVMREWLQRVIASVAKQSSQSAMGGI